MANFTELINDEVPVLVDFHAEWCGPCKAQAPILEDLARKMGDKARIIKVDVDRNPQAAMKYDVKGVPTLLIFQKGKVLWRGSGVRQADELEARLLAAAD
ncbi:MAG: thioredoxin [Bacteroidota bacterium]|nr:thioredoxin [Bacteroidota bacterium]